MDALMATAEDRQGEREREKEREDTLNGACDVVMSIWMALVAMMKAVCLHGDHGKSKQIIFVSVNRCQHLKFDAPILVIVWSTRIRTCHFGC